MDRRIINRHYNPVHFNLLLALAEFCKNEELNGNWPQIRFAKRKNAVDTICQSLNEEPAQGGVACYYRLSEDGGSILVLHEEMSGFSSIWQDHYDDITEVPDEFWQRIPFFVTMSPEELAIHIEHHLWSPDGPTLGM